MRNLQKILALVLALVMSLSLMATAGAREFTDGDQIDETFAESVDVLTGLEVFQGYPTGDFQPKGDITRAEVAAIIYRIATGDVTDSQVGIYADYNKFSDVPSDNWAAGYINYCANAEYIKGRGDGKFYPQDKVTGYEALAMILRVVGYDKNGEFTGADWQVQTAATANQRKVTKNVNAGTLGNPASRETVAELLCQAILIEKVNYTLAFGYQISTNPEDTIAYETFKMERLTGVVTGNEIADLKETSPMAAGQTRMVIDGNERTLNVTSGLEDIGKSVRVYVRPQSGTTRYDMVTADVYATELNKVYDSFASVSSVGNSTASAEGITSIAGAEHYINYDYVTRWTARMRITYVMDLKWTEYQAYSMRRDNDGTLYPYVANANMATRTDAISLDTIGTDRSQWKTRLETSDYTYTYVKTIALDEELTQQDWDNLKNIFTDADKTGANWLMGEVYIGTASFTATDDISDDIRWEDFVNTYLKNEETRQQVESNRLGDRLIIVDNDNDGIAEYVLQTRYTIAKVVPNGSKLTLGAVESKFDDTNDRVNIITASDDLVSVSGKELAASEEALATGDVVIYALIDGNIRAQKAETETARITAINRGTTTVTYEGGEKKQSGVHPHAEGLTSGVAGMVIGTNYTMYFDLDGNLAAYTEGDVGSFVLITDGWYNQAVNAREYAVQAYIDGRLQTVNVTNNGSYFIGNNQVNNNNWTNLKNTFGNSTINSGNTNGNHVQTIVANLEDGNLIPVDKSYRVSQRVVMLDMVDNKIPTRDNNANGNVYTTDYADQTAYLRNTNGANPAVTTAEVLGRSDTVYYYVHNLGGTNNNGQNNYVVRTFTGYNNIPAIDPSYIEDVYAVGIESNANNGLIGGRTYYTAEVVVVELNNKYIESRTASEQVFIPATGFVSGNIQGGGIETVNMIRGNGEYEESVLVDMRQSTLRAYDTAVSSLNTSRSYAGLYYMDPVSTNDEGKVIYKIVGMDRADIRSNNYLVGYVSQTNTANDHVRVDAQTIHDTTNDACDTRFHRQIMNDPIVSRQGATITSASKLYKLSYNGSGIPTLNGSLTAAEVFYKDPNPNTSDTEQCYLNELWNGVAGAGAQFNLNQTTRNEVLIRYDANGNMIWAISFNEFRTGSTRDLAQTVWYNMLPAREQNTGDTKFMDKDVNELGGEGTITNPYQNSITHTEAVEAAKDALMKVVDVKSVSGSVMSYTLQKRIAPSSVWTNVDTDGNGLTDAELMAEAQWLAGTNAQVTYQLAITLNQGTPVVYNLVKDAARSGKTVTPNALLATIANNTITPTTAGFQTRIDTFIESFGFSEDAKPEWHFYNAAGEEIDPTTYGSTDVVNAPRFVLTVTAEDGSWDNYLYQSGTALPGTTRTISLGTGVSGSSVTSGSTLSGSNDTVVVGEVLALEATGNGKFYIGTTEIGGTYSDTTGKTTLNYLVADTTPDNATITFKLAPNTISTGDASTGIVSGNVNNLTAPVTLDNTTPATIAADTTINLNGQTLTFSEAARAIEVTGGELKISNGTIVLDNNTGTASIDVQNDAKLTLERVTISGAVYPVKMNQNAASGCKITVKDSSITSTEAFALTVNGNAATGEVVIENSTLINEGTIDPALYIAGAANVTITGDNTLISGPTGIEMRNGTLNLNGGTIRSTNSTLVSGSPNSNGNTVKSGAAIVVSPHMVTTVNLNVNIIGGTIEGTRKVFVTEPETRTAGDYRIVVANNIGDIVSFDTNVTGSTWTKNTTTNIEYSKHLPTTP